MIFVKKTMAAFVLAMGFTAVANADDLVGTLTPKPEGAAADVTAVLHVKKKGEEKKYNLVATGDAAKQVADFLKDNKLVKVTGDVTGESVKVASVTAEEKKKKGKAAK